MGQDELLLSLKNLKFDPRGGLTTLVRRMMRSVEGDTELQPFLEEVLPTLVDLFSASAGTIWLRAEGIRGAAFALRHRMNEIQWSATERRKHDALVQFAWQQRQPILAEPSSAGRGELGSPAGHALIFGPVIHLSVPIALVELCIPVEEKALEGAERRQWLRALQLVIDRLHFGLQHRMNLPQATLQAAGIQLKQLEDEIHSYQQSIRRSIETRLRHFQGWSFGSLQENQKFAKLIHQLLESHGLRVRCNECGNPAILRCLNSGNSKDGAFVFDHYLESGRTFHGGPITVPALTIVAKPARRVSSSSTEAKRA